MKPTNYQILFKKKLYLSNNIQPQSSSGVQKKKKNSIYLDGLCCPLIVHTTDYQP